MFTAAAAADGKKAAGLPCIGISIGLDRIFALVWPKWVEKGGRCKETMVYVMAAGDGLLEERIKLVRELRESGIKVGFLFCGARPTDPARALGRLFGEEEAEAQCTVCGWGAG
jgi:histidyl-tRNA synthetase